MHPILRRGDFIIISPFVDVLESGDLILIRDPLDKKSNLVRRVVAVGGEQVGINSNGTLHIGGNMIEQKELDHDENYRYIEEILHHKKNQKEWRIAKRLDQGIEMERTFTVSSDKIFVISDNRDEFMDSRLWGSLRRKDIIGKVILRIGPKDLWQDYISFL